MDTRTRLTDNDLGTTKVTIAQADPMLGVVALRRIACRALGRSWCELSDAELFEIDQLVHDTLAARRVTTVTRTLPVQPDVTDGGRPR